MKCIIEEISEFWQRNHMIRGEGRSALPVQDARDSLLGRKGSLDELRILAQPVANAHLATITVRHPDGNATFVTPA